jgi:hypothetical protein
LVAPALSGCTSPEAKDAAARLSLTVPVKVVEVDVYADGGTTEFRLKDARGQELIFFHEGVVVSWHPDGTKEVVIRGREVPPDTPVHLYMGGTPHEPVEKLTRVEAGSEIDQALLTLLQTWRRKSCSDEEIKRMKANDENPTYGSGDWIAKRVQGMEQVLQRRIEDGAPVVP